MRHYETTYVIRPNLGEAQFTEIIERTNEIIANDGGTVIAVDRWGIRNLAYEIKKESQGYYVHMNFAAPPAAVAEMERIFRIDDRLLRYLTIKLADAIDAEAIQRLQEQEAAPSETEEQEEEQTAAPETGSSGEGETVKDEAADTAAAGTEKA